ncbi:ProQ/FINO family protein [Arsenophonus sp. ENCA]|uniref:ProQ/FINO family protein n=1 Tax=Arsenophonus sp. ENCA TaxID=1987579 RepID=UPI0025C32546|nr:ProQ/FINO family protein [Arsenophonus sp. ENCA]
MKVKIPKPPKKRLLLEEATLQITTFWPNLFPDGKLCPMKIGIQQDMWQEVKENGFPIARRRLRACLGSIGHHADYRALIQLGAFANSQTKCNKVNPWSYIDKITVMTP